MGYETTALIAFNRKDYPSEATASWENEYSDIVEEVIENNDNTYVRFMWSKITYRAVEEFLDSIVITDSDDFTVNETFGILSIGEDDTDYEYYGSPWDFDIGLERSLMIWD